MYCSSEETETSGKASRRVALEMNIEEGGSEMGSVVQAERINRIDLMQGRFL